MSESDAMLGFRLLRLAPLVIPSAALMCGIDQTITIKPFTRPELAKETSGLVLPRWFPGFFDGIIIIIAVAYPLAITTAYLNTVIGRQAGPQSPDAALISRGYLDGRPLDVMARSLY